MAKPAGHPVPLHRVTHRLGDHQPYLRTGLAIIDKIVVQRVHDDIGLGSPYALANRDTEISGACHPVPGRKHCRRTLRQITQ
ncbi:hypothetical protein GCM10010409_22140 [Mycolicibacterium diernhoferi]